MRKTFQSRGLRWALALVGAGALLAYLVWPEPAQRLVLADGREVAIVKVSYGTRHRYVYGPVWVRGVAWTFPKSWLQSLGAGIIEHRTETPTIMVWARWNNVSWRRQAARVATLGEQSVESSPTLASMGGSAGPTESITSWAFPNYPRRNKNLILRAFDGMPGLNAVPATVFTVANPSPSAAPEWIPEPRPQARLVDGVRFVLSDWVVGSSVPRMSTSTVRFEIHDPSQSGEDWSVTALEVLDVLGNRTAHRVDQFELASNRDIVVQCHAPIWSSEQAFRVTAEFAPPPSSGTNSTIRFSGVPLPEEGDFSPARYQHESVVLEKLARLQGASRSSMDGRLTHRLMATFQSLQPNTRLHLNMITDQTGRHLNWERLRVEAADRDAFQVEIANDTQRLEFVVQLLGLIRVEFLVPPPRLVESAQGH